jgi:hypothetical protein
MTMPSSISAPNNSADRATFENFYDGKAPWDIGKSVQPTRIDVNPEFTEVKFSEGGPKAWFAIVRRKG